MSSVIQSLFIQRFAPYIARALIVFNATLIAISLVLFTLAWSTDSSHTDSEALGEIQVDSVVLLGSYKQLGESRLWPVSLAYGGGFVVTDNGGLIKNKTSAKHSDIYLSIQTALKIFTVFSTLIAILLLVSSNYLRLVTVTSANIILIWLLDTPFLFDMQTNITGSFALPWSALSIIALSFWSFNKWLVKNSHVSDTLIAYASQSGSAMSLAKRFKKSLFHTCDVRCVSTLEPGVFTQYDNVLLIASTYGEGQPPEKAHKFVRKLSQFDGYQSVVNYSILALGDRHYGDFCAFGHQLEQLLSSKGAKAITDLVEVDRLDSNAINQWWQALSTKLSWRTKGVKQEFCDLLVTDNMCCNPSQDNRHAHIVQFDKQQLSYQPGDLLAIAPERSIEQARQITKSLGFDEQENVMFNKRITSLIDALTHLEWQGETAANAQSLVDKLRPISPRVYSIASSPYQDTIELLVRRHYSSDKDPGLASHYLCDLAPKETISADVRVHSNFHLPAHDVPLILIGAGTGLAPLIGFLRHRAATGSSQQHWLFFGEQHKESDFYFADEINAMHQQQLITALNLAWSRDENRSYIGEHILRERQQLLSWVDKLGAYIYICGNQSGFGDSVCAVLAEVFGQDAYENMISTGQLRTDLY
ncbi:MAG: flavodoxin domain-containing protein [Thalassotalea sp.]|nr:flavodoxin domain-containing protein [Thalassotalea sp.]